MAVEPESGLKYDVDIDTTAETSHTRILRLVGAGTRVLDLGCATGSLAKLLKERGCDVVGVEGDPAAAALAEAHCSRVLVADLDSAELVGLEQLGRFDVVIAADVLEHLTHPEHALALARKVIAPTGYLLTSIPNVAHGSVRLALLAGRFPYGDLGLLDETHVRFFTRSSMTGLLSSAGFDVAYVEDQTLDPEQGEVLRDVDVESLPADARKAVRDDPDSAVYQFIAVSTPDSAMGGLPDALHRLGQRVRSLENDVEKKDRAASDALFRHQSELQALIEQASVAAESSAEALRAAETDLLAAKESTLAATRAGLLQQVRAEALEQRLVALEAHCAMLASREADRQRLENELLQTRRELDVIFHSKLWRFGSAYRRMLGNSLARG